MANILFFYRLPYLYKCTRTYSTFVFIDLVLYIYIPFEDLYWKYAFSFIMLNLIVLQSLLHIFCINYINYIFVHLSI